MSRYSSILYISFHVLSRRVDTIWRGAGRLYKLVVTPGAKACRRSMPYVSRAVRALAILSTSILVEASTGHRL